MPQNDSKISLIKAIVININVILGAGLFINPRPLTQLAGHWSFISYMLSAIVLLPIVLSIAKLAKNYPTCGGMYVYSQKCIGPFVGFLSGWGYFLGKTTSAALLAHTFAKFIQRNFICLQPIPTLFFDFALISLLVLLNIFGVKIGGRIQYLFISLKSIPVTFVLIAGFLFFNWQFFDAQPVEMTNLLSSIPISIFALTSFEMICSIGHLIDNPEKNINRAILFSFLIVASIASIFQLLLFGAVGLGLANMSEPAMGFASIVFPSFPLIPIVLNAFVFTSIIGGSFGSLTGNCWNLFKLAEEKFVPFSSYLVRVNKHNVPWISLVIEGLIACMLLAISLEQIPLQNMTVLGIVCAYFFSSLSLLVSSFKLSWNQKLIPIFAILSSSYIIYLCFRNLVISGISFPFLFVFIFGVAVALFKYFFKYIKN